MRWIRNWLIAFFVCLGIVFITAIHLYFILAIATVLHDFDHLTEFEKYATDFLIGSVLISSTISTWFAIRAR